MTTTLAIGAESDLFDAVTDDNKNENENENTLILSSDQDNAFKRITNFILDPAQYHLILRGFAGTGKSTLLRHVFDSLPKINKLADVTGDNDTGIDMLLTATTNKAAGALMQTTGRGANTIHSELSLIVQRDPLTQKPELTDTDRSKIIRNKLIVIDEAYMADIPTLKFINQYTENCKFLWVGDPAQLLPVGLSYMPLIGEKFPEVSLNEIIRQQADSPIIQLATLCRFAVETGRFFKFKPDGDIIKHVDRTQFGKLMLDSFDETYGIPGGTKVLSWTNKTAQHWNGHVKQTMKGTMQVRIGDYLVCNKAISTKKCRINTDQVVQVTDMHPVESDEGLAGHMYTLNNSHVAFMPDVLDEKVALLKTLRKQKDPVADTRIAAIEDTWIDLRDEYACTVNKSQGSTYGTTFIDLADIGKCNMQNQLARLLYVSISRPRDKIVFTGDIR